MDMTVDDEIKCDSCDQIQMPQYAGPAYCREQCGTAGAAHDQVAEYMGMVFENFRGGGGPPTWPPRGRGGHAIQKRGLYSRF